MSSFIAKKIKKTYAGKIALSEFSLEMNRGDFISIVGESGSGKSTLLRIMAGLEVQDSGQVFLENEEILNPKKRLVPGYDEVKLIHQDYHLLPNSTVSENIRRPLLQYDKNYAKAREEKLLEQFGLKELQGRFPRQLSGGQQQKVAIAAALAIEPEVLLLDEPFSSLDTIQKHQLIDELGDLFKQWKTTVVFVTHDLDDALRLTDNLIILKKGKVVQKGNSFELCTHPQSQYVARLFSPINAIPGQKDAYLRPNEVKLRSKGGLLGHVVDLRFLVHYNLLQIKLKESNQIWEVDDPHRKYQVGDRVYVQWEEEKVMLLPS